MDIITSLVVGAVIGFVVSLLQAAASREDLIRNIASGVAGAYVGCWLLGKLVDSPNPGGVSIGVMVASMAGAAMSLLIVSRFNPS